MGRAWRFPYRDMRGGRLVNGHLGGREQAMNAGEMGQWLRDARNRLGKTQEEVADELGVPANPVWHWEAGRCRRQIGWLP